MRREFLALCAAVLLLPLSWQAVRADEEKVPLDKLPKAVSAAVTKRFPKAKLVKASKEKEDGKPLFEVSIEDGKTRIEVTLTPAGEIVEVEKEIAAKDLPKAVSTALEAKYPKATLKKVEEVTKGKEVAYEVLLVAKDKKMWEVKFDATGKVLNTEEKKGERKGRERREEEGQEVKAGPDGMGLPGPGGSAWASACCWSRTRRPWPTSCCAACARRG